ncbi:hypothetical protein [Lysobacter enzymogenes]|uniref:hypothetical protein n=1 Tax=Lysobacter enzymogenes TaxID=69 RepID=UPI0008947920|nr:hypothetical protein [Lysobacter enzymogenes]SDX72559.1 hypothetical protein SAMN05421681_107144 [Lysobacter enzymogenes]
MTASHSVAETTLRIACRAEDAWNTVCFYEHIRRKPSLFLRSVLPVPMYTTGCAGNVGDTSRCLYSDGGYLAKRITGVIPGERIEFEVIEHSIRYCRSIALKGGSISVIADQDGACSVHMLTRCELQSRWLRPLRPFIEFTISAMHRIVMRDMQERLEARDANRLCASGSSA